MAQVEAALVGPVDEMDRIVSLLSGDHLFSPAVRSRLDAHEAILRCFSYRVLTHLVGSVAVMQQAGVMEKAVGISLRTFQRHKKERATMQLGQEQSGRIMKFAENVAHATWVLGSREDAESWLSIRAIGLKQQRPIYLLATTAGVYA